MTSAATPLTISATMIRNHLSPLAVGWFDHRNLPPPTVQGYAEQLDELQEIATEAGDLPWLVLGLQHLLLNPAIEPRSFVNSRFAYSDDEAREIFEYVLARLAPGQQADPAGPAARVVLAEMPRKAWAALRDSQTLP